MMPGQKMNVLKSWYGQVAHSMVLAALAANADIYSDTTVLDGDQGLWYMMGVKEFHADRVLERLGSEWLIMEMQLKRYRRVLGITPQSMPSGSSPRSSTGLLSSEDSVHDGVVVEFSHRAHLQGMHAWRHFSTTANLGPVSGRRSKAARRSNKKSRP
jgi:hypothetical protein